MATWTGKSRGNTLGYKIFIFLIKVNIRFAYILLLPVAFYFLIFSNKKSIKFYFREIHNYSKLKTLISIYRTYCYLGEILIDRIAILSGLNSKFSFDFEGEEYLHEMAQNDKGGLLIGAHMGNWEVAGQLLERIESKINIVMYEAEHAKIKELLNSKLDDSKTNIILVKQDFSHLFEITKALKNRELVAIHGDRFLPGTNTVEKKFLLKDAHFPAGPLYLASKNKVPVSFVYTLKESKKHYHFYATKGKIYKYPANLKNRRQEVSNMLNDYVSELEKMVLKYPLQWFNFYPFWSEEKE